MVNHKTKECFVNRFSRIIVPRVVPILLLVILFTQRKGCPLLLNPGISLGIKASFDNDRRPVEQNGFRLAKTISCILI